MLSVAEALMRVTANIEPLSAETVPLAEAHQRILAEDIAACLTQPPFAASAMDGYAVRRTDCEPLPARLSLTGESAAGHPFAGPVGPGETVRIFTGAVVPEGADHIVIQENVAATDGYAEIREINNEPFIRAAGSDFTKGSILLRAGKRLSARDLLLAAQMNRAALPVRRKPKIAILASGDELVSPGHVPQSGQIVSSIPAGLAALLTQAGADACDLGIAKDTHDSLAERIAAAAAADLLVTIGGASVGDHDLVRAALEAAGFTMTFHKIAMRPGKPLMSGARGGMKLIGLPGNPVSAMVCSIVFILPLVATLLGEEQPPVTETLLPLAAPIEANGPRQHYMRARYCSFEGRRGVKAFASQDSSLTSILAAADCLIVRQPAAPAAAAGTEVSILPLSH